MKRWENSFNHRVRNRIVAAALAASLGLGCISTVYASAISDAQDRKEQAQSDLDAQNEKINEIEGRKDSLQSEINNLDAELVNIIANMSILEDELSNKEDQLVQLDGELTEAEEDERTQYENMKKRIRYMYENGNTSFVEIILGARDFADFLNRVEYAGQVYGHDRDLLASYQETVQTVSDLKLQVEGEKAELEQMHEEYQQQQREYQSQLDAKRQTMADFDTQLAAANKLASKYRQVIAEQNELIQAEEQRRREEEERRKREEEEQRRREEEEQRRREEQDNISADQNGGSSGTTDGNKNTGTAGDKNPAYATKISGAEVVNFACQFIGNPYVFGGTSLTDGCDCSGFVMSVYEHFGVSLPHNSFALQSCGKEVSYKNAKPGDVVCYAGHVGIYIGNGQIVNASSSAPYPIGGIKTNSATYRQILSVRRVL